MDTSTQWIHHPLLLLFKDSAMDSKPMFHSYRNQSVKLQRKLLVNCFPYEKNVGLEWVKNIADVKNFTMTNAVVITTD